MYNFAPPKTMDEAYHNGVLSQKFLRSIPHSQFPDRFQKIERKVDPMIHVTEKDFDIMNSRSARPVTAMFYAPWCARCSMMRPVIEDIEKRYKDRVNFFEINADISEKLAGRFGADILPTFVFFQNGKAVGTMQGVIGEDIFETRMKKIFQL